MRRIWFYDKLKNIVNFVNLLFIVMVKEYNKCLVWYSYYEGGVVIYVF